MQQIKNYIINLLGGYTAEEYSTSYRWYTDKVVDLAEENIGLKSKLKHAEKRLEELAVKNLVKSKGQAKTIKVKSVKTKEEKEKEKVNKTKRIVKAK